MTEQQQFVKRGNAFAEVLQCGNTSCHRIPGNLGFPGGSDGKESAHDAGDPGSILGQEDPLKKEMATHFSILAWRIP